MTHAEVVKTVNNHYINCSLNGGRNSSVRSQAHSTSSMKHSNIPGRNSNSPNSVADTHLEEDSLGQVRIVESESDGLGGSGEGNRETRAYVDGGSIWEQLVWPEIQRKIAVTLTAATCVGGITHRDRSFEFLGFDVCYTHTILILC